MPGVSPTLLTPYGYSSGTCGYCSPSGERSKGKTSFKYGMVSEQMTPRFYQNLIDRGWRRSGDYLYHPDMARTCCPQYTIRLNALDFHFNKKQKQVINRFNRYLETGQKPGDSHPPPPPPSNPASSPGSGSGCQGKGKNNGPTAERNLFDELHAFEDGFGDGDRMLAHRFETELVPAKATPETFELYKAYQVSVHKDKPSECTMRGFSRFLCGETLVKIPIEYKDEESIKRAVKRRHLPSDYGQYHLLYRVDSKLIGISVVDVLPACVSSVYFIWHPDWAWASLGKLSALYEVSLVRRMNAAGAPEMKWSYMGYWVPDCQKMRYKSEYAPSELLDPGTNVFHPLSPDLEKFLVDHPTGYFPFESILEHHPSATLPAVTRYKSPKVEADIIGDDEEMTSDRDDSDDEEEVDVSTSWPSPSPPGFADPSSLTNKQIESIYLLMGKGRNRNIVPVGHLEFGDPKSVGREIREFVAAVGIDDIAHVGMKGKVGEDKALLYFG
ncbi:hypothetical protein I316_05773 [Kwoniella heveanensis BCC8398]|uniref:arginyltransferase n=1 Tax=Kwoniella heveanensis BCC8398 TaxID=1296120 RepID=A0A1B9GNM7_9TREE|nr:hypothetical protein I316_05773 [Kwoniella heveanensis BCC8398]